MLSVLTPPRVVKAGPDEPMDSQLILFIGRDPFDVLNMQSFIRLKRWDGRVIDVLVLPHGNAICLAPECGGLSPCAHTDALQLHGLLPRVPAGPRPAPMPRPVIVPDGNGKPVAPEGHPHD